MEAFEHTPGQRDFLIEEKDVPVTEFRRKPSAVWWYRFLNNSVHVFAPLILFSNWNIPSGN